MSLLHLGRALWVLCLLLVAAAVQQALAWDSVGHRVTAAVAVDYLDAETRRELILILQAHPRFTEDFQSRIPGFIDQDNELELHTWLLGQAAYWPDIARGLPESERARYNRPTWHYTDGAWIRDSALVQGNIYIGIDAFPDLQGESAATIQSAGDVGNVVTALDWSTRVLADTDSSPPQRAIALCWVLHLVGDIHQPLHTGSAYSVQLLARGDQGGNAIPTDDGNLHGRWDSAVRSGGVTDNTALILQQLSGFPRPNIMGAGSDWTEWMSESRQLLQSSVYTDSIRNSVLLAEAGNSPIIPIALDREYVEQMQRVARQRLGLAGLRLAIWFTNELD